MVPGQEANAIVKGSLFDPLYSNGMLSVLIRITLMRQL